MTLSAPEDDDISALAKSWIRAKSIVRECCGGAELDQSLDDLDLLQRVLDVAYLRPNQTYELQCLGVAIGRVLTRNVSGLDWAVVDDQYGRDPTVRFEQTSLHFNVLTMVSKRVEDGDDFHVRDLYDGLLEKLAKLRDEVD